MLLGIAHLDDLPGARGELLHASGQSLLALFPFVVHLASGEGDNLHGLGIEQGRATSSGTERLQHP